MQPGDEDRIQQVVQETKELIKLLEKTNVRRLSLDAGDFKIEIERSVLRGTVTGQPAPTVAAGPASHHQVRSPLDGTFYLAQKPGSKPFVEIGARIQRGQTIGIIDVMKTMNEIPSDAAGVVVQILVPNGQAVRTNEALIVVDTASP